MTVDEAIKFLIEDLNRPAARFKPELQEARRLGIVALKRHSAFWSKDGCAYLELPGETED